MTAVGITAGISANRDTAKPCGRKRNYLRSGPIVMQTARGLFPSKTARYLSDLTGDPVRTWEYWLSKERLPGEALGALLRSEHGLAFIDVICSDSPWWRAVRRKLARADEQEHQLKAAADALRSFTDHSEEDAALVPVPNMARVPNSPMAQTKKGRR